MSKLLPGRIMYDPIPEFLAKNKIDREVERARDELRALRILIEEKRVALLKGSHIDHRYSTVVAHNGMTLGSFEEFYGEQLTGKIVK